jgi:hypothetical protein
MRPNFTEWILCLVLSFMITSPCSSLIRIDPATNPQQKTELLSDLHRATGLWLDIKENFLRELAPRIDLLTFGDSPNYSATAKCFLLGALRNETVYRVSAGQSKLGNAASRIDLNFNQLKGVTYRDVPREAFGAGMILLHELAHIHRGLTDPNPLQKKENPDVKGATVEFINIIQRELGLPERLHYFAKKLPGRDDVFCIYFGKLQRVELDSSLF